MADQADAVAVDLVHARQRVDRRQRVLDELLAGRLRERAARGADTAVVQAEHGDPRARERVGEHEEGTMTEDRFVAVLRPGAGQQQHRRMRSGPLRQGQRPGQREARPLDAEGELSVREGGPGRLRPPVATGLLLGQPAHPDRQLRALGERALGAVAGAARLEHGRRLRRQGEGDPLLVVVHRLQGRAVHPLGGNAERGRDFGTGAREGHEELQLSLPDRAQVDRATPALLGGLRRRALGRWRGDGRPPPHRAEHRRQQDRHRPGRPCHHRQPPRCGHAALSSPDRPARAARATAGRGRAAAARRTPRASPSPATVR